MKSFFKENGIVLTEEGESAYQELDKALTKIYKKYRKLNYSPETIRDAVMSKLLHISTFHEAIMADTNPSN